MRREFCVAALAGVLSFAATPSPTMSADAAAELRAAIDILKTRHMNRDKLDWPKVEAEAFAAANNAKRATDTYAAIRDIIKQLGEKHTHLVSAEQVKARNSGSKVGNAEPPYFNRPEALILADGIVMLRVPGFQNTEDNDRLYVRALRTPLAQHADACRFIVDLRGNHGGSLYPMLNGLRPFLGNQPYGYWVSGPSVRAAWQVPNRPQHAANEYVDPVPALPSAHVAVLIDAQTASSGEYTAMAFEGLPNVRFFGEDTAGYLTANVSIPLPDGAEIAVSIGWGTDRFGTSYRESIAPQQPTTAGQETVDAAIGWLKAQRCP